jgi:hypothetical protein
MRSAASGAGPSVRILPSDLKTRILQILRLEGWGAGVRAKRSWRLPAAGTAIREDKPQCACVAASKLLCGPVPRYDAKCNRSVQNTEWS